MKNFYEVGRVYIWQNVTVHGLRHLNGKETTVTGDVMMFEANIGYKPGQTTDTYLSTGQCVIAQPGYLRPKKPPPGEQSVMDMFKQDEPAHA